MVTKKTLIIFALSILSLVKSHAIFVDEFLPIQDELSSNNITSVNVACTIDIHTQTGTPQPVFIRPSTSQFFLPANRDGQIQLSVNEGIELWCSGAWTSPSGAPNSITATCVSGQTFRYNNANLSFNSFRCQAWPQWTTRRTTTRCFSGGILVDVGFQIGTRWLHLYTVCHDLVFETNWYVHYAFSPVSAANQRNVARPAWTQTGFYTASNVNHLYTRPQHRITIANILGDQAAADRFIESEPSDFFFARGHIAAMTDFILASQQQATFHFLNAAPQWQTFNGANWDSVEISSRRLASDRGLNLDVYTGTFGITNLWNTAGVRRQIFLDWPAGRIPAPQIYYKILINQADLSGVVLIGVNNPWLSQAEINSLGYVICPDVSSQISYVSWSRTNLQRGFGYACEVHEFSRVVPHIDAIRNIRYRLLV
ncbi:unnamed protein product [Chironomus riparius]|uniref:DNA/RNA non-specific endonuclease/pyrophosphatase/phosphodiesterase domain-containing protein n=1 Tax=Chironomus riparius TaxID=315576 RepID=A0A9N9S870_9DIPT|nr:unnamed protein product [Chironomus riparius]